VGTGGAGRGGAGARSASARAGDPGAVLVLVDVRDEKQQVALLERSLAEGWSARRCFRRAEVVASRTCDKARAPSSSATSMHQEQCVAEAKGAPSLPKDGRIAGFAPTLYTQQRCDSALTSLFRASKVALVAGSAADAELDVWHVVWVLVLVVGVVLLASHWDRPYHRESSTFANVARSGALCRPHRLHRDYSTRCSRHNAFPGRHSRRCKRPPSSPAKIEEAARQAQEAVKSAQEQTRQVLERVKSGVREATYWTLLMWMKNLRQAAMQRDWPRALLFAEECRR